MSERNGSGQRKGSRKGKWNKERSNRGEGHQTPDIPPNFIRSSQHQQGHRAYGNAFDESVGDCAAFSQPCFPYASFVDGSWGTSDPSSHRHGQPEDNSYLVSDSASVVECASHGFSNSFDMYPADSHMEEFRYETSCPTYNNENTAHSQMDGTWDMVSRPADDNVDAGPGSSNSFDMCMANGQANVVAHNLEKPTSRRQAERYKSGNASYREKASDNVAHDSRNINEPGEVGPIHAIGSQFSGASQLTYGNAYGSTGGSFEV